MQLAAAQLSQHLQKGLRPLYTLHGDEPLLIQEAADAIRAAARAQGYTERTVHTVAGAHFDWSEVLAAGGSLSLFADTPDRRDPHPLGQARQGRQPGACSSWPRAPRATKARSRWCCCRKLDKATTHRRLVRRAGQPRRDHPGGAGRARRPCRSGSRSGWRGSASACMGGEEGQRTLQFFADRVEGNLLAAHQEIQKLALLYPAGELGFDQVESAVLNVARYDVFKLSEAVLGGQAARVQRMLDGLRAEGEAEVLVHYTLAEDIRALKRVKDAMAAGRPLPMALREQRVWGLKERLFERVLPRLTPTTLDNLLHSAHLVDGIVKGLKVPDWPTDGWQALQRLAHALCQQCMEPRASRRAALAGMSATGSKRPARFSRADNSAHERAERRRVHANAGPAGPAGLGRDGARRCRHAKPGAARTGRAAARQCRRRCRRTTPRTWSAPPPPA